MKKILLLVLVLMLTLGSLAACFKDSNDTTTTTSATKPTTSTTGQDDPVPPTCNVHVDEDTDYVCDNCGTALERPSNPPVTPDCTEHKDEDGNNLCDNCGAQINQGTNPPVTPDCTEHKDEDTNYICDNCGAKLEKPNVPVEGSIDVTVTGFGFETVFCEWKPLAGADSYNVYCNNQKVDTELIRNYGSYYRCDVLGIKAGEYTIDIYAVDNGEEIASSKTSFKQTAIAHLRDGFGFVGGSASGAYNDDGTLKSNAQVIYVTATNADTVKATVNGTVQTGLQTILDAKQKANTSNDVLCIRIIGMISATDMDHLSSSSEGLQIKGRSAYTDMNITFEGVGNDATINGFGFLIRNCKNVEIRNIAIIKSSAINRSYTSVTGNNTVIAG